MGTMGFLEDLRHTLQGKHGRPSTKVDHPLLVCAVTSEPRTVALTEIRWDLLQAATGWILLTSEMLF